MQRRKEGPRRPSIATARWGCGLTSAGPTALALALASCAPVPELDARVLGEQRTTEGVGTVTLAVEHEPIHLAKVHGERSDTAELATLGHLPFESFGSSVSDMSDDGSIIIGNGTFGTGHIGFRWTEQGGMQPIPKSTGAIDISPNGRLILGVEKSRTNTPWDNYVLWEDIGKPPRIVIPHSNEPTFETQYELVQPLLVLDDASMYGWCLLYSNPDGAGGCIVDPAGNLTSLSQIWQIHVADLTGNYGGNTVGSEYFPDISRAFLNGNVLQGINGCDVSYCEGDVQDFSAGAKVAVGTGVRHEYVTQGEDYIVRYMHAAFVHTADNPMRALPDLPGESENAGAYAISDDGAIIGGYGHDREGMHAVVWIDRQPKRLRDLIIGAGGTLPAGYRPFEIRVMSADGRVFAGNGVHVDGTREPFRAVLPRAR